MAPCFLFSIFFLTDIKFLVRKGTASTAFVSRGEYEGQDLGKSSVVGQSMARDPLTGKVVVAAYTYDSPCIAVIRSSSSEGQDWTTIDSFQVEPGKATYHYAMRIDSSGNYYAVGSYSPDGVNEIKGYLRKSTDGGST
jgi:hypothetical protein